MKRYLNCMAIAMVAICCHAELIQAQTYQDILQQVSTPGLGTAPGPRAMSNSVYQQDELGSSTRVPSAIVENGQQPPQPGISSSINGSSTNSPASPLPVQTGMVNGCNLGIQGQGAGNPVMNGGMVGCGQGPVASQPSMVGGFGGAVMMQPRNVYAPAYTAPVSPVYVPGQNFGMVNPAMVNPAMVNPAMANPAMANPGWVNPVTPGTGCVATPAVVASPAVATAQNYVAAPANFAANVGSYAGRNLVFGLNGLIFDRDYEDDVFLVRNPAGDILRSTDADVGNLGGLEFFIGSRNCNGNGFDVRYWGLFTEEATYTLTGASFSSYIPDLANVMWPANGRTILDVFDNSTSQNIHRDNEIHNVEFNLLRNAGCYTTRRGRQATYELLAGFRWFEFAEEFHWDVVSPTAPTMLFFDHNVQNTLLGFQLGGRSEICLTQRLRFNVGTKLGIFNNRSRVEQFLQDETGQFALVDGAFYSFRNSKNDVSMLGELNVGTAFHLNPCSRLNIGYRAIGVSGIALAPNQLNNFNSVAAITNIQSNANLLLHGAVFGLEFCR